MATPQICTQKYLLAFNEWRSVERHPPPPLYVLADKPSLMVIQTREYRAPEILLGQDVCPTPREPVPL